MNYGDSYNVLTGTVVSNVDPYGGNRITVKMGNMFDGGDKNSENNTIWCSPLLPKLVHVIPQPDELVLIFLRKAGAGNGTRYYLGPILSQPQRFSKEVAPTAQSFMDNPDGEKNTTLENPNNNERNKGSIPELEDISIIGRKNTELRLKDNEVRLMCGYKQNDGGSVLDNMVFNKGGKAYGAPAFIQMKFENRVDDNSVSSSNKNYKSDINLFADRINLISTNSDVNVGELDNSELITNEKMADLMKSCHPLVYGDKLIEFLNTLRKALTTHTHPFSMLPPIQSTYLKEVNTTNLDSMLSKSVKTC